MSEINRPPIGLQSLLGSQNFGVNPSDLGQQVQPTLDMLPFFGAQILRESRITGSRTTPGIVTSQPVRDGEVWWIHSVANAVASTAGAGDVKLAIALRFVPGDAPTQLHYVAAMEDNFTAAGVGESIVLPWDPAKPLLLESGQSIDAVYLENTTGLTTAALSVLYYALEL